MHRLLFFAALVVAFGATAMATAAPSAPKSSQLAQQLALARVSTAQYATNLDHAKANGYGIITQMIPSMGWHYMNANVKGFDIRKPQILVYLRRGANWQLGALEWVFPKKPASPPVPGAKYGVFGAACHYVDGTFVFADAQSKCTPKSPTSGAAFNFWHDNLVTMHIWLWYPNPSGLFAGTNPLATPFDRG